MAVDNDSVEVMRGQRIHHEWVRNYRSGHAARFYTLALEEISRTLKAQGHQTILDAGCGSGLKTNILASHGLTVTGCDFSEAALDLARQKDVEENNHEAAIFVKSDITSMEFADEAFDAVFCWGVLMHILEVEKALSELCRVVRPNGSLVIGINNKDSLDCRIARRFSKSRGGGFENKSAGWERHVKTPDGLLLVRQANIGWLVKFICDQGFSLESRTLGQFTEFYNSRYFGSVSKYIIHAINNILYRAKVSPALSAGNILVFKKRKL